MSLEWCRYPQGHWKSHVTKMNTESARVEMHSYSRAWLVSDAHISRTPISLKENHEGIKKRNCLFIVIWSNQEASSAAMKIRVKSSLSGLLAISSTKLRRWKCQLGFEDKVNQIIFHSHKHMFQTGSKRQCSDLKSDFWSGWCGWNELPDK